MHKTQGWNFEENINQLNTRPKKPGVYILMTDNTDFEAKSTIRDRENHHIMVKEQHETLTM